MDQFMGIGILVILLVVALIIFIGRYKTASPDKALIVSGSFLGRKNTYIDKATGNTMKVVRGGGTFVIPVFQTAKELSLLSSKLEVSTPAVYTEEGVPVSADGTVIIKVGSTVEEIATAAEQYLSKPTEDLENEAREVLEGHLRSILGSMTVEEIYKNRDKFSQEVQAVASVDLAKMGLVIVSFTVKEVTDENGYLDALGQPRIAQVKRDAYIAQAEADKETRIKRAQAEQESQQAEILRETQIAESNKQKELKLAAFRQEQDVAKAKADNAYALEKAQLDILLKEKEMNVEITERVKQIELEEKEIVRREKQYDAEVRKKADAERYAIETKAAADKQKSIWESEARAKEKELNGLAESASILAIGEAEAKAKEALANALKQYGEAAILTMLIEKYPDIVRAAAEPISNIDRITVIDGGNGSQGAAKVANYASQVLTATQEGLKETTGLDVTALIESFVGNKNIGSKLGMLNETMATEISADKAISPSEAGKEPEMETAVS
ncbi:flotillin family protein [Trichococcus shcherbakoviae]|nr:flotillin family protein [Trichococcus shcherbakoviae]